MKCRIIGWLWLMMVAQATFVQAQNPAGVQGTAQEKAAAQVVSSSLAAYTGWLEATSPNHARRDATPHYTIAVVAQRLSDATAQVEALVATDKKNDPSNTILVRLTRKPAVAAYDTIENAPSESSLLSGFRSRGIGPHQSLP
jgi:hypothetical protein